MVKIPEGTNAVNANLLLIIFMHILFHFFSHIAETGKKNRTQGINLLTFRVVKE